mgnify:CR=1 FL=1
MARIFAPLVLVILLLLGAFWRTSGRPRADLVIVNRTEVSTLDPSQLSWQHDFRMARLVYEGLTRQDALDPNLAILPAAAESWEVSADGRVYLFRIRGSAKWSTGDSLGSDDFVAGWQRMLLPDAAADYLTLFHLIEGGQEFSQWRATALQTFTLDPERRGDAQAAAQLWQETLTRFQESVGVKALDDRTLEVRLIHPVPYFLDLLAFPAFVPQHASTLESIRSIDPRTGAAVWASIWTKPASLVTNGPMRLTEWRFKRGMRFEKDAAYWDASSVTLGSIDVPTINDPNAQVLAFRSGAADWVSDVSPGYRGDMIAEKAAYWMEHAASIGPLLRAGANPIEVDAALPADPSNLVHVLPSFGTYFYNFNCGPTLPDGRANPFADARVRKAFSICVDKQSLTGNVRRSGEPVAHTLIPPGSIAGHVSPKGLMRDDAAAAALFAAAGYTAGAGFPEVELLFNKDGGHDLIAQAVARDWARALGVKVRLVQKETKVFSADLKAGRFMISRASWFGDYGDATTFLDINRTGDGNNDRRFSSLALDRLLDAAANQSDPFLRSGLLAEAERVLIEDECPVLPLFHYVEVSLFDATRLQGLGAHPRQIQDLARLRVIPRSRAQRAAAP